MKNYFITQEVLLITTTSFTGKQMRKKDTNRDSYGPPKLEQLKEDCWNGFLYELLPGIIEQSASGDRLYLWQIRECESFLEIELGEFFLLREKKFSVNPYVFLSEMINN